MFFDLFDELCKRKGITPNKACIEIGVSRTAVAKWKAGGTPNGTTTAKIAAYFNVSTDYLLGKEKSPSEKSDRPSEDDIKIALFGGDGEVTDAMWEEAKNYAAYIKERERKKLK